MNIDSPRPLWNQLGFSTPNAMLDAFNDWKITTSQTFTPTFDHWKNMIISQGIARNPALDSPDQAVIKSIDDLYADDAVEAQRLKLSKHGLRKTKRKDHRPPDGGDDDDDTVAGGPPLVLA